MKSLLLLLGGLVLPPLLALRQRSWRSFALLLAIETAIVLTFFFAFWGPAVLAHVALWLSATVLLRPQARQRPTEISNAPATKAAVAMKPDHEERAAA